MQGFVTIFIRGEYYKDMARIASAVALLRVRNGLLPFTRS